MKLLDMTSFPFLYTTPVESSKSIELDSVVQPHFFGIFIFFSWWLVIYWPLCVQVSGHLHFVDAEGLEIYFWLNYTEYYSTHLRFISYCTRHVVSMHLPVEERHEASIFWVCWIISLMISSAVVDILQIMSVSSALPNLRSFNSWTSPWWHRTSPRWGFRSWWQRYRYETLPKQSFQKKTTDLDSVRPVNRPKF